MGFALLGQKLTSRADHMENIFRNVNRGKSYEAIRATLLLVIADHVIPRMSMFHRKIHLHYITRTLPLSCQFLAV